MCIRDSLRHVQGPRPGHAGGGVGPRGKVGRPLRRLAPSGLTVNAHRQLGPAPSFTRAMCAYSRSTRVEIHHLTGGERYGASVRRRWRRGKNPVLILLGLGVLWAAVRGPQVVRHRHRLGRPVVALVAAGRIDGRRLRSVRRAATSAPSNVGSARRRRRDLLLAMAGIAAVSYTHLTLPTKA